MIARAGNALTTPCSKPDRSPQNALTIVGQTPRGDACPRLVVPVVLPGAHRAASAYTSPDQQNDDGADDGADDPGGLEEAIRSVLVEDQVSEESAHERTDDAQDDGHRNRQVLLAWNAQPRQCAGNESDDDDRDNESKHGVRLSGSRAERPRKSGRWSDCPTLTQSTTPTGGLNTPLGR